MKRILSFLLALLILLPLSLSPLAESVSVPPLTKEVQVEKDPIYDISLDSQGVYLENVQTGTVLYQKAENARMFPASTTKIMTALVVLEHCDDPKNTLVTVKNGNDFAYIAEAGGVNMALVTGEVFSVYDLLLALMLNSYCDVADLLALHFGDGNVSNFVEMMNRKAEELGLENTHFENAHGLHHSNHYSSPKDIASIFAEAVKNPLFRQILSTREYTVPATQYRSEHPLSYTVGMFYPSHKFYLDGFVGGKSGFTNQAGRCLVTLSEKDGVSYISVLLGANLDSSRRYSDNMAWLETNTLVQYAYEHYHLQTLFEKGQEVGSVKVTDSDTLLPVVAPDAVSLLVRNDREAKWTLSLPKEVEVAQVEKSLEIGRLAVQDPNGAEQNFPLMLSWDGTPIATKSFLEKGAEKADESITRIFKSDKVFVTLLILLLAVIAICIPAMKITKHLHKKKSHIPKH